MGRRISLPLTHETQRPTVDAMRKRLGGRAASLPGAGELVRLTRERGLVGVVICVGADDVYVWVDDGLVRRVRRADAPALEGTVPDELGRIANDARLFGSLSEGDPVAFEEAGQRSTGVIVEKCRFGALVERTDGAIVGLGFRRLSPRDPHAN